MNWRTDIKAGDRIRLTLEGVVGCSPYGGSQYLGLEPDNMPSGWTNSIHADVMDAPTTKIEKLQRPIKVGDRVRTVFGPAGKVVAICGAQAWVCEPEGCSTFNLADLELVE